MTKGGGGKEISFLILQKRTLCGYEILLFYCVVCVDRCALPCTSVSVLLVSTCSLNIIKKIPK